MNALLALGGAGAIALGLAGTWLAGRHAAGWLVCIVSSALWVPTLVTGGQWVAVFNCGLSIAICLRNFVKRRSDQGRSLSRRTVEPAGALAGSTAGAVVREEAPWLSTTSAAC